MTLLRIGEVARIAGISTRAVRHYHWIGLLPEPARRSNGYRGYEMADVVRVLRVRRLADLGLSLDEVADALADDQGRELREIVVEIAADLAEQEARIRAQRERLLELATREGDLTLSAELAEVLAHWEKRAGDHPAYERERRIAEMIGAAPGGEVVASAYQAVLDDDEITERGLAVARRFEKLTERDAGRPVIDEVAAELIAYAQDVRTKVLTAANAPTVDSDLFLRAVGSDLNSAQRQCFGLLTDEIQKWG
ncbi:MerR family transcriptional regulator [Fodinicola feengrottensis]